MADAVVFVVSARVIGIRRTEFPGWGFEIAFIGFFFSQGH